ncbi:MAG: bifunctional phosphopantothenoylcysteine decarboxylase/phosphopantothenate--cysteine ligase CoaBC [Actinomycetota bacterium]|nr:bifunctional phosphopantothenoylcysteine decarboxylase/phosphopantothenate--cysteine ligase CoaBC [Actinomycetota bacterium]
MDADGITAVPRTPRVVLGVSGGIAAYKAAEVLRGLTESGCDVTVVPTPAALNFVGAATWSALSGKPVSASVWDDVDRVPHVRLGQQAEVILVAPATADLMARAAHGMADDLLTSVLLTARCPVVLAPAMHTEMWEHPATRQNVALLRERGVIVLEPSVGRLTGADSGPGRLPEPSALVAAVHDVLRRDGARADLTGLRIVVSAGGTRESWDPVRFIGNVSSGRQGVELARTALSRGARVTLVAAHMDVDPPAGAKVVRVSSAEQMRVAMHDAMPAADIVVMAAAVADFRPAEVGSHKFKRSETGASLTVDLVQNPDILLELVHKRGSAGSPLIVGFAAETGDAAHSVLELAHEKLVRKGCDLLVVNDVSDGRAFGQPDNEVVVIGQDGSSWHVPLSGKAAVADAIWDVALRLRS